MVGLPGKQSLSTCADNQNILKVLLADVCSITVASLLLT